MKYEEMDFRQFSSDFREEKMFLIRRKGRRILYMRYDVETLCQHLFLVIFVYLLLFFFFAISATFDPICQVNF